jgi:hypothetical protein
MKQITWVLVLGVALLPDPPLLADAGASGAGYYCQITSSGQGPNLPETTKNSGPVRCTSDAKLCPDGSFVERVGPNCEFAPCPDAGVSEQPSDARRQGPPGPMNRSVPIVCTQEAKMCPDGSFVERNGPTCEFAPCPGAGSRKR